MEITADYIIDILKEKVAKKEVQFDAQFFIETALKLNILLGDEQDKMLDLAQKVAEVKMSLLDEQSKKNVSEVRLKIEANPIYTEYRKQELKCKRIEEFIKVSKKMSDRSAGIY